MTLRLLGLLFTVALAGMFGQFEFQGLFGKITSRPKAGDLAPEISFVKVLHNAAAASWTTANLNGQVTVLQFLPYVSGNPRVVSEWNALVEAFVGKPVQFAWITGEQESTLLPFLTEHPIRGWMFHDPEGKTGQAYGLESPQPVIVGADQRIVGFGVGLAPTKEVISAVLEDRISTTPPKQTLESFKAFFGSGLELLSAESERMPREEDLRPKFSPSYTVHIAPAKDALNGSNNSGMDYWSLQGFTLKRLLAEMLELNAIRIELPASIDASARYDFSIVLPKFEDREVMRRVILQGVEDYFHLRGMRENRLRNAYVLTASKPKLPASVVDPQAGGFSSFGYFDFSDPFDASDKSYGIDAMTGFSMGSATVEEFCHGLERSLDRPLVNETKLDGRFDFQLPETERAPQEPPIFDFVERLREQLGLVITTARRSVETMVYRVR